MANDPEQTALMRAIADAPDDDTPRFKYADWLDSHGNSDRARLIRVQCSIEQLRSEERALIERFGHVWGENLFALGADEWAFHRGFPEEFAIRLDDFMTRHGQLNEITPIRRLRLRGSVSDDTDADLTTLAQLPVAKQFTALEFEGEADPSYSTYGLIGVRALARSEHLSGLRELVLHSPHVGPDGVAAIADSPVFGNLARLVVTDPACQGEDSCLRRVVQSPRLPNLATVQFGDAPPVSVKGIRDITAARITQAGQGVG